MIAQIVQVITEHGVLQPGGTPSQLWRGLAAMAIITGWAGLMLWLSRPR